MKSKFYQAKVAFEIPLAGDRDYITNKHPSDELVNVLMDLFSCAEFEWADVCNPDILIVNTHSYPSKEWCKRARLKIDKTLKKWYKNNK
jgi:hypothetical protein